MDRRSLCLSVYEVSGLELANESVVARKFRTYHHNIFLRIYSFQCCRGLATFVKAGKVDQFDI